MTQQDQVNNLFKEITLQSDIKYVFDDGFCKYIVYDSRGTLFVIGFNKETKKYGFGRTPLMLREYAKADLPTNIMPDYASLYTIVARGYRIYQTLQREFRPISDFLDMLSRLSGKGR